MNFWENVDSVREYREISRKELAYRAGFSLTSLSTGIKRNSIPSADVAYRIAKTLDVSIEYLLTGTDSSEKNEKLENHFPYAKFLKYKPIIEKIDLLPENIQGNLESLINNFSEIVNIKV